MNDIKSLLQAALLFNRNLSELALATNKVAWTMNSQMTRLQRHHIIWMEHRGSCKMSREFVVSNLAQLQRRPLPMNNFVTVSALLVVSGAIGLLVLFCERKDTKIERVNEKSLAFLMRFALILCSFRENIQ